MGNVENRGYSYRLGKHNVRWQWVKSTKLVKLFKTTEERTMEHVKGILEQYEGQVNILFYT